MFDLVIRSDRVVTPAGVGAHDVAIREQKIAAVAASGTFDAGSTKPQIGEAIRSGYPTVKIFTTDITPSR